MCEGAGVGGVAGGHSRMQSPIRSETCPAHPPLRCRQLAGAGWWHSLYGAIMTFTENSSTVVGGVAECASPRFAVADQEGT